MTAIFLDRDGVLNENRSDYVKSWEEFRWLPGALDALRLLATLQLPVIVVTNQSAVGRGIIPLAELEALHHRMGQCVRQHGGRLDAVFVCPHHPDDACACRKPLPGLLQQAARVHGVDLSRSVFIGDAATDYAAAHAAGVRYLHVCTGRGAEQLPALLALAPGAAIARDLAAAAEQCRAWLSQPALAVC